MPIPNPKRHEISDIFTRVDEQLDVLIRLQVDQNNLLRALLGRPTVPTEPGPDVNISTYLGATIHRENGVWTVTYEGETFTGTWEEVLTWIDEQVITQTTGEILTDIYNVLATEDKRVDIISLALTIPADTAEGSATSVTEITRIPYKSIAYVTLHFTDAARLKAKVFVMCNGVQILPVQKEDDAVNYVSLRDSTITFPINYPVDGTIELVFSGWNEDTENAHQIFALVGVRRKE